MLAIQDDYLDQILPLHCYGRLHDSGMATNYNLWQPREQGLETLGLTARVAPRSMGLHSTDLLKRVVPAGEL